MKQREEPQIYRQWFDDANSKEVSGHWDVVLYCINEPFFNIAGCLRFFCLMATAYPVNGVDCNKSTPCVWCHKGRDVLAEVWMGACCTEQIWVLCVRVWTLWLKYSVSYRFWSKELQPCSLCFCFGPVWPSSPICLISSIFTCCLIHELLSSFVCSCT